ncbi:hypothetical protein PMIN06_001296 [Paraphaeosphaeria minitans]|uniref:Uncharacterized protein n=1 Tax=Paraphaeosphaeria minitans TaxID=565426 RepID=A0A9P6GA29_9PLEO|nr:hypothetical protein PMIN01_11313 [Paraphaeosphaeria minitans]
MASNASKSNPANTLPQTACSSSSNAAPVPPTDDLDGTPTRSSLLTGYSPIFTVSPQTSPILLPPIYRELNDPRTTIRFTWRIDSPTTFPSVFPLPGVVPATPRIKTFTPVTDQELNGIEPIFQVSEQSVNLDGGVEGRLMIDQNTPFLVRGYVEMGRQQSGPLHASQCHKYQDRTNWGPATTAPPPVHRAPGATSNMSAFDAPTGYHYQKRLATIPEDNTTPFGLNTRFQNAPNASNGMATFASPTAYSYQHPLAPIPSGHPYLSAAGNAAPAQSMPNLNPYSDNKAQHQYHSHVAPNPAYLLNTNPTPPQAQTPPPNRWPLHTPTAADVRKGTAAIDSPHWEDAEVQEWVGGGGEEVFHGGESTAVHRFKQKSIPYEGEGDAEDWVEGNSSAAVDSGAAATGN